MSFPEPGQELLLEITDLNHAGEGVGRHDGLVVFVPLALPGERVRAVVEEARKSYLRARLKEVVSPSPHRLSPPCPSFGYCGGCQLLHLDYAQQLRFKEKVVQNALLRLGKLPGARVLPVLGMENPWHYRCKVRFHVTRENGKPALGLYAPGSHTLGYRVGERPCFLLNKRLNALARALGELLRDCTSLCGGLLAVTLRLAAATGEAMVVLEGRHSCREELGRLARELALAASVTAVVGQWGRGKEEVLWGEGYITERLGNLVYRLSATSFFQVNPAQTLALYRKVAEYAALSGRERVVDAYCGVGTIALYLARHAGSVVGVEVLPQAVADAQMNAAQNGISNVFFACGAAERLLPVLLSRGPVPEVVVLDPPRAGCRRPVLEALVASKVPRVVYVSCDPATLARDLGFLAAKGYRVVEVQPLDMFPQTHHVECVTLLVYG